MNAMLPEPSASRAVLVGVSSYRRMPELPAVRNNLIGLAGILTDPEVWGMPAKNCSIVANPESASEVLDPIHDAARSAEAALVVYFAGHGLLDETGELYLGLPDSSKERLHRAVSFKEIRREVVLTASRCFGKIVILDCCYSATAMSGFMSDSAQLADHAVVDGAYLMTATAESALARAPIGAQYTAFTGALVDTLREGLPDGPELLDMDALFTQVERELRANNLPIPQRRSRDAGHRIAIARNRAAVTPGVRTVGGRHRAPERGAAHASGLDAVTRIQPRQIPVWFPSTATDITDPQAQVEALQQVGEMLAGPNPPRAVIADAEQLARRVTRRSTRETMLLRIVAALALQDPDDARRLANDITDRPRHIQALQAIARALATQDMRRANDLQAEIAHLDATDPADDHA